MERWAAAGVTAALLAATAGCGASRADRLHARAAAHVYHRPAPEVAETVRALLRDKGFAFTPASDDVWVRTQWKWVIDDDEFASVRVRYVILVKRLTAHHCRVEAARLTLTTVGMETYHPLSMSSPTSQNKQNTATYGKGLAPLAAGPRVLGRDTAFEWELLRRIDAAGARRIEASLTR